MRVVAVLGLGVIGRRLATRLLAAGHEVVVWNRTTTAADQLVENGARAAETPREAVRRAEVVLVTVSDDAASRSIWMDASRGAVSGLRSDALAADMSALSPSWGLELAQHVTKRARAFVDAPIAALGRGPDQKLVVLAGGERDAVSELAELLAPVVDAVHRVGPSGCGSWMNLVANVLLGIQVAALAELAGVMQSAGLDVSSALRVLGELAATSASPERSTDADRPGVFESDYPIRLIEKDFRYLIDAADRVRAEVPVSSNAREVYARAQERGLGDEHLRAIGELYD